MAAQKKEEFEYFTFSVSQIHAFIRSGSSKVIVKLSCLINIDRLGETCEIMIEVYVHKDTAWTFNSGQDKMEDILVLNLKGGKDLFVSFAFSRVFNNKLLNVSEKDYCQLCINACKESDIMCWKNSEIYVSQHMLFKKHGNDQTKAEIKYAAYRELCIRCRNYLSFTREKLQAIIGPSKFTEQSQTRMMCRWNKPDNSIYLSRFET